MKRYNEELGCDEKFCRRCKDWWPATNEFFYSNSSTKDGLYNWCTACYLEYRRSRHPPKGFIHSHPERNKEIISIRDSGATFQSIGEIYGISRQRAHQICKVWSMKVEDGR